MGACLSQQDHLIAVSAVQSISISQLGRSSDLKRGKKGKKSRKRNTEKIKKNKKRALRNL